MGATSLAIVADVADPTASAPPSAADAEVAIARLEAMSLGLRGGAILDGEGSVLAASGDAETWEPAARELLAAADAAAGVPVIQVHVGTEDGEAFAVRHESYAAVAASDRFTLASLMFCDLRAVLRDLLRGPPATVVPAGNGSAPEGAGD